MKALILAAGYGGRMRPLTDSTHKTLLKISGETIISRILNTLKEVGIINVIVVLGYRENELRTYLENTHSDVDFEFVVNERYAETNNIFSLAMALEKLTINDDIILIESDLIFRKKILQQLINNPNENVALVDKYQTGMDGTVVKIKGNKVTEVIPPHLQGSDFNFNDKYKTLNVYKFSRHFINGNFRKIITYYAKTIDDNCYYELILGILIYMQQEGIYAEIVDGEDWAEVDDPNDLNKASFVFDSAARFGILEDAFGGYWNYDIIDFCFIRNMYFPTDSMISEMKGSFEKIIYNYGSKQRILNKKLSYALLCKEENIHLLNGASQIYPILQSLYKESKVLLPEPTFGEYTRIFSNREFYQDTNEINTSEIETKLENVKLAVFVNPNNPTGSILKTQWIYDLAKNNPQKTFIVDESFISFSEQPSITSLLEKYPLDNIIVITSLSKTWGIPGIRLGYCYTTNNKLMIQIKSKTPIWNSNSLAEFFLEVFLKNKNIFQESLRKTKVDRNAFIEDLTKLSIVDFVYPSEANFILIRLTIDKKQTKKLATRILEKHNTYIKDISSKFSDNVGYLRLAIRTYSENKNFIDILTLDAENVFVGLDS